MQNVTRAKKRELNLILREAHEAELASALGRVEEAIRLWRSGTIRPSDAGERIHQFHKESQEIYKTYNNREPVIALLHATVHGFVAEETLPDSLRQVVSTLRGITERRDRG